MKENKMFIELDLFGSQSYIFNGLTNDNPIKRLRGKSALIQIYSRLFLIELEKIFPESKTVIFASGKVEIEVDKSDENIKKANEFQLKLDKFFIEYFHGEIGVKVLIKQDKNEILVKNKFQNEVSFNNTIYDVCPVCNRRNKITGKSKCGICETETRIGEKLSNKTNYLVYSKEKSNNTIDLFFEGYTIFFSNKYVSNNCTCIDSRKEEFYLGYKNLDNGLDKLAGESNLISVIKGDLDSLGEKFSLLKDDIKSIRGLSSKLNNFFGSKLEEKIQKEGFNTVFVFTGGDDVFLFTTVQDSFEVLKIIKREVKNEFKDFNLTISLACENIHYKTPPNQFYELIESSLDDCKDYDSKKNKIKYFGEIFNLDDFLNNKNLNSFYKELNYVSKGNTEKSMNSLRELMKILKLEDKSNLIEKDLLNSKKKYFFNRLGQKSKIRDIYYKEKNKKFLMIKIQEYIKKGGK